MRLQFHRSQLCARTAIVRRNQSVINSLPPRCGDVKSESDDFVFTDLGSSFREQTAKNIRFAYFSKLKNQRNTSFNETVSL